MPSSTTRNSCSSKMMARRSERRGGSHAAGSRWAGIGSDLGIAAWASIALGAAACSAITGLDDFQLISSSSTSGSSSTSAGTAGGGGLGGGGVSSTGPGGTGGQGGAGQGGSDGSPVLVDEGLIARYFINEADVQGGQEGQGGQGGGPDFMLHDAATSPQNLPVTTDVMTGEPVLVEEQGHWGLRWSTADFDGSPALPIEGTKIADLDGNAKATVELVLRVATVSTTGSMLISLGTPVAPTNNTTDERLSLKVTSSTNVQFLWDGQMGDPNTIAGAWTTQSLSSRHVIHLILDTTSDNAASRVQLYVNGNLASTDGTTTVTAPGEDEQIELTASSDILVFGNRPQGGRSFEGMLYYAALYDRALTPSEVQQNTDVLAMNDDGP